MEKLYKRVDNLDDKIKDMSLLYLEWKLLFLITDRMSVSELKKIVDKDADTIKKSLEMLVDKGLIESIGEAAPVKKEEKKEELQEQPELKEVGESEITEDQTVEDITAQIDESEGKEAESADIELEEKNDIEIIEEPDIDLLNEKEASEKDEASMSEIIEEIGELEKEVAEEVHEDELSIDLSADTKKEEPQALEKEEVPKKAAAEAKRPSGAGVKTVMVVDDSIVIRKMVEIALEEDDYKIITAISGKEGMQLLDQENPNLVILDMMLPDMNGIDLLKAIKASKGIPVIMLSGKDSPQLIETAKGVGADDFLPKPFRDEELIDKVKTLLK